MTVACDAARAPELGRSDEATVPGAGSGNDAALRLADLPAVMARSSGSAAVAIGLIDGPVALGHPDLAGGNFGGAPDAGPAACGRTASTACAHGTAVAGILSARRGSAAPAIAPGCTLLVRPIFGERVPGPSVVGATPEQLAEAILDCLQAGARVLNVSSAMVEPAFGGDRLVDEALDTAARSGAVVVVAAGNQASIGHSAVNGHPAVLPVVACDREARPMPQSNLGRSIGRRGLRAPGEEIVTLGPDGRLARLSGTSAAAPFVTGSIALLWSAFPAATGPEVKAAVTRTGRGARTSVVPPLLDAWAAYGALARSHATERRTR